MWASFSVSCLFAVVLLYLPGCLFFGDLLLRKKILIAWAPFVSLAILAIFGRSTIICARTSQVLPFSHEGAFCWQSKYG